MYVGLTDNGLAQAETVKDIDPQRTDPPDPSQRAMVCRADTLIFAGVVKALNSP
jgi:hypothetical protein